MSGQGIVFPVIEPHLITEHKFMNPVNSASQPAGKALLGGHFSGTIFPGARGRREGPMLAGKGRVTSTVCSIPIAL